MRLKTLSIHEFKGVREFALDANGQTVSIYAANGVGKTSVEDAFSWLLSGKDSLGRADFGIIPTYEDGLPMEDVAPTVIAELELPDGNSINLMRRLVQRRQSVRGASPTAAGTTTEYSVDFVPVKKAEFQRRIAEIADETLFPLLTDPRAFCGSLHWQKRRDLLLSLFGDATDADIMASDADLADLPALLGKRTVDDHRRMLSPKLAGLKKQLDAIPSRVDEVKRSMPPAPDGDPAAELAALREERSRKQAEFERIAHGGEAADLRRQLAEINARIVDNETAERRADAELMAGLEADRRAARASLDEQQRLLDDTGRRLESVDEEISRISRESAKNSEMAKRINSQPPPDVGFDDDCPTCGQQLPPEHIRAAMDKAIAEHNRSRSEALERVTEMDAQLLTQLEKAEHERNRLRNQAARLEAAISESDFALRAAEAAINYHPRSDPQTHDLQAEAEAITTRIAALDEGNSEALASTRAEIDRIDAQIAAAEIAAADIRAREQATQRIAALNAERRTLAAELESVERELDLCSLFIRRKVEHVTHTINSRFDGIVWKLFDTQVNGEIVDCCEATVNGVAWRDLSNSQQINAGLAVIDVIGQQYGVTPPIFIDNAESVSTIRPTKAQQIRLIVDPAYKQLTVEQH